MRKKYDIDAITKLVMDSAKKDYDSIQRRFGSDSGLDKIMRGYYGVTKPANKTSKQSEGK